MWAIETLRFPGSGDRRACERGSHLGALTRDAVGMGKRPVAWENFGRDCQSWERAAVDVVKRRKEIVAQVRSDRLDEQPGGTVSPIGFAPAGTTILMRTRREYDGWTAPAARRPESPDALWRARRRSSGE